MLACADRGVAGAGGGRLGRGGVRLPHVVIILDVGLEAPTAVTQLVEDKAVDAADEATPRHVLVDLILPHTDATANETWHRVTSIVIRVVHASTNAQAARLSHSGTDDFSREYAQFAG